MKYNDNFFYILSKFLYLVFIEAISAGLFFLLLTLPVYFVYNYYITTLDWKFLSLVDVSGITVFLTLVVFSVYGSLQIFTKALDTFKK